MANTKLPSDSSGQFTFETLIKDLVNACLGSIDNTEPFTVECDTLNYAIGATLTKTFDQLLLCQKLCHHRDVASRYSLLYYRKRSKDCCRDFRKWSHYLIRQPLTLVTDQRFLTFLFNLLKQTKTKNRKIEMYQAELSFFRYSILHKSGVENIALPQESMEQLFL